MCMYNIHKSDENVHFIYICILCLNLGIMELKEIIYILDQYTSLFIKYSLYYGFIKHLYYS